MGDISVFYRGRNEKYFDLYAATFMGLVERTQRGENRDEGWWDKERAQLSGLPDLQSERELPKQGNRGYCLKMSGI